MGTTGARNSPMPIIAKCFRERCRPGLMLAWGLVTLAVTTAVCLGVYLTETERGGASAMEAARAMIVPVIIIQAVVLMFLGTGAVAFGISGERDAGVLDYQRMTPMSTPAKLLGYLLGLPIREYILFAFTMPFLLFGVIRGGFGLGVVAHFYLIFALSVVVYHLTGLVAGMISIKARRAAVMAQIFVVGLYFVLPQLSHFGLTFFEFLTIRPALFGLIQNEVHRLNGSTPITFSESLTALDTFRDIPFFNFTLHPTVYTIVVQSGLILLLWHFVARKWRSDEIPGFSKIAAILVLFGGSTLVLGSAWAALNNGPGLLTVLNRVHGGAVTEVDMLFVLAYILMLLAVGMFAYGNASPSPFLTSKGFRRMRKQGRPSLGVLRDESSSLPIAILAVLTTSTGACLLYDTLLRNHLLTGWPSLPYALMFLVTLAAILLFGQAVCERCTTRNRLVIAFIVWVIPMLLMGVLGAGNARSTLVAYAGLPFPPAAAAFAAEQALSTAPGAHDFLWARSDSILRTEFPMIPISGAVLHIALAGVAQTMNLRDRARRRRAATPGQDPLEPARAALPANTLPVAG